MPKGFSATGRPAHSRSLLSGFLATGLILAAAAPASAFDEAETSDIERIVRDYLIRNPEVLLEALDALEAKRAAEILTLQREAIESASASLFSSPEGTILGNPQGDVTVVEFFDYNCGFCKSAHGDMLALIQDDPELRFVLKESPLLGPSSEAASRVSLAVRQIAPDRYVEFHSRLLSSRGVADESRAMAIAAEIGLEEARVREAMSSPAVLEAWNENGRLSALLQISGTPSYVVGDQVVPGAIGAEALSEKIDNVRRCGQASC